MVLDLDYSKEKDELLASRKISTPFICQISFFWDSHQKFSEFYSQEHNVCYCNNIKDLMQDIGCDYDSSFGKFLLTLVRYNMS